MSHVESLPGDQDVRPDHDLGRGRGREALQPLRRSPGPGLPQHRHHRAAGAGQQPLQQTGQETQQTGFTLTFVEIKIIYSFVVQVFVSYNMPEDNILTPLVIEKLVAEIKSHPDKF